MSSPTPRRIVAAALSATGAASLALGIAAVPSSVWPTGGSAGEAPVDATGEPAPLYIDETGILRR